MAEHPNQALVRRGFEAFNKGDMDTLTQIIADDAVQMMPGNNQFSGEHKGRDNILAMYGRLMEETGGTFKADLETVYANDHNAVGIYHATAERKGKKLDERVALLFEIVNGKAVRLTDIPEDAAVEDKFFS
jgi:uncharacterized protein